MIGPPRDHYHTLGIAPGATAEMIRNAYRRAVKRTHPDRDPSPQAAQRFIAIQRAYETLRDPLLKHAYDLRTQRPSPPRSPAARPSTLRRNEADMNVRSWPFLALHLTGLVFGALVLFGVLVGFTFGDRPWYVLLLAVPGLMIIPEAWQGIRLYSTKPRDGRGRAS